MKNKLYIAGLVCITLLTYSCSNDDNSYEVQQVKINTLEIAPQAVLKSKSIDSTATLSGTRIISTSSVEEGDPSNPLLPR